MMSEPDPLVTTECLASGFLALQASAKDWVIVRQDHRMPPQLRRALALLSRTCLKDGVDDRGSCIHDVLAMAREPMREWGIPSFADAAFPYADTVLVDGDLGVPTADCITLAAPGSEIESLQNRHHQRLRAAVATMTGKRKAETYTAIREFAVRNPVVAVSALKEFVSTGGRVHLAQEIESFYERIPIAAIWPDGTIRTCVGCGGLLWPDVDQSSYPNGRCHLRQCVDERPTPSVRDVLEDPDSYYVVERAVNAFWVGPGLDEIRIYDELMAAGVEVTLYPQEDLVDVGKPDLSLGIDAKSYASPIVLARRLSESVGGIEAFDERYLVVPDAKKRHNPDYVRQLRESYDGTVKGIRFMTVMEAITDVIQRHGSL